VNLPIGERHALTQRELARRAGIPVRAVQAELQAMRLAGEPICTGDAGVWLAETADELARSNARLAHRIREQQVTLAALNDTEGDMRDRETRARLARTDQGTQAGLWS
jgi:hypothetical protein